MAHPIRDSEAVGWSAFYVALPLAFGAYIWTRFGSQTGVEYLTGYLVEKSLSVDNLFVFMLLLTAFAVPAALQQRVLLYGIVGALVLRGIFIALGAAALSDAELIAILIGSGTRSLSAVDLSKHILGSVGNDLGQLARMTVKDLQRFKGIGEAKAISIVSALELGRRRKVVEPQKRLKITSSSDVFELMKPELLDETVEHFYAVLLNRANIVIKKQVISQGGTSATIADPKLIFKYAMDNMASSIILMVMAACSGVTISSSSPDKTFCIFW